MSPRFVPRALAAGCLATLIFACYGQALIGGQQFAYRDALHYYYPLHWRVQAEWEAGRWPLWEPEENGGMPLLGNPTAAVLYPGKVVFALLPYALAARLYVVGHTVLAAAAVWVLLRSWRTSVVGSALAALSYAFGAPVLFQYCNVIYLVGAAWMPLGFYGADRWIRLGLRQGLIVLALVLAMLLLGGDPESAYVLGVYAGGYALALAWSRGPARPPRESRRRFAYALSTGVAFAVALGWFVGTLVLARRLPAFRPPGRGGLPPPVLPWMSWVPTAVAVAWLAAGLVATVRWWRGGRRSPLFTMGLGLAGSATLAAALAAAQLVPVIEMTGQSMRAAGAGLHDIYPFSLEPFRIIEFAWPNIFGANFAHNRSWLPVVRPAWAQHTRVWVPSLYLGGLTLVLSLGALGFRSGGPGRGWLTAVALTSLIASCGEFTGPLWWARCGSSFQAAQLGAHDPPNTPAVRQDGQLRDGDGGAYWLLATLLPGFRQFRYPSKLLTFTTLALAGLAGLGWDRVIMGRDRRRTAAVAATLLALGLLALIAVTLQRSRMMTAFQGFDLPQFRTEFGPLDAKGAVGQILRSLSHGSVVLSLSLVLLLVGKHWPLRAGVLALAVMTADLALANAHLVRTVPQAILDSDSKVVKIIREAEARNAGRGGSRSEPFRVHRMPLWSPLAWQRRSSEDRIREIVAWEHDTIQPKYGLTSGIHYTVTHGAADIYEFLALFGHFYRRANPATAQRLGIRPGQVVAVFPRRSFDLWNTRYFVVPADPHGWADEGRGFAAFLEKTERIYPAQELDQESPEADRRRVGSAVEDFQVFRNLAEFPRAWVVHSARFLEPMPATDPTRLHAPMQEIAYSADPFWYEPGRPVFDPRVMTWLDADKRTELTRVLSDARPSPSEAPTITRYGPQEVEIEVTMATPGLVILSDLFYPGWRLAIDGVDSPIYRANLVMRGAAVAAGRHRLIFRYEPQSFRIGAAVSVAGLAILAAFGVVVWFRPMSASLAVVADGIPEAVTASKGKSLPS